MNIDMTIENAKVYNTYTQRFEEKIVTIQNGRFYHLAKEGLTGADCPNILDAKGCYMIPGLIDIHMHIESSMTVPEIFSKAVLPYGVTTVVADPHEIANVFGLEGIEAFISNKTLLDIFYGIPSSVPSTSEALETTGGQIGIKEIEKMLESPQVRCLGEVMNFRDLVRDQDSLIKQIIKRCQEKRPTMPIEGHCPKVSGLDLSRFINQGIDADHTQQSPELIWEKICNGMFLEIQGKSITKENIEMLVKNNFYEYFALVTDDVMADHLLAGHLNKNLIKAVSFGMPMEKAIYVSTYTPARRMGFRDRGAIAPGRLADFIFLEDLETFKINQVYKKGSCVYRKGDKVETLENSVHFPDHFYHSLHCRKATLKDFAIKIQHEGEALVNVIRIQEFGTFTERVKRRVKVVKGELQWEEAGLALLLVMERYGKNGNIAYGLVENALTQKGATATTWAHDHHNIMVMGTAKNDMLIAQHRLLELDGGYVVVKEEKVTAEVALEVGGIVSCAPLEELGGNIRNVRTALRDLGYKNNNEIMSFSTLSLPVSPEIKITDVGLLDSKTLEIIPLIEELI